ALPIYPGGFIRPNVVGTLGPRRAARLDHHTWAQIQQILVVALIQWHIVDVRVVECAAQGGVGGLHERDGLGDGDALGLLAGLNGQVHSNLLTDFDRHVLTLQSLKAIGLCADDIGAGNKGGSVILPGVIAGESSRDAPVLIYDRYRGARDDTATLVCNGTENASEI